MKVNAGEILGRIRRVLELAAEDPARAADQLDAMGDRLKAAAASLRERASQQTRSRGGMGDRVQMRVVGPGGHVTQSIDTGA